MQTIDITDFWINRPTTTSTNNFSILSDRWCSLNNCTIGNGKAYYYNGLVDKQQLKCIVIDDTFYFDFSANSIVDVIKQQMWILKHTKNVDYKIEFVCLWEMFKLPTIEQLNEFAKIKQEIVVPEPVTQLAQSEYANSIEEMRLSTGLSETDLHPRNRNLSEYIQWNQAFIHSRLNNEQVLHHSTVIYNYHNPVVQAVHVAEPNSEYTEARDLLMEYSNMTSSDLNPALGESLADYIESLEGEVELPYNDILHYGTIVYNYNRGTVVEGLPEEELEEITEDLNLPQLFAEIDNHPF